MSPAHQILVKANLRWNTQHVPSATENRFYTPDDIDGASLLWIVDGEATLRLHDGRKAVVFHEDIEIL
jgi:hypothetical protein